MKKLVIVEPGMQSYTGHFAGIEFVDGISVEEVPARFAARICNIIRAQDEDGKNLSDSQAMIDIRNKDMGMEEKLPFPQVFESVVAEVVASVTQVFTREQLEAVADAGGLNGLRKIADPMGLRSTGIVKLMDLILASQAPAPAVTFIDSGAPEVAPEAQKAPVSEAAVTEAAPVTKEAADAPAVDSEAPKVEQSE